MVQVGQFVASKLQNKIMRVFSATDGSQDPAATCESVVQRLAGIQAMENWSRVSSPFHLNRVRAGRGRAGLGGVVCLLGGISPPIAISVGSMGHNCDTEVRIGQRPVVTV